MPQFPANIDLSSLDGTTGFKLSGGAVNDNSGASVASAGDVNGDGFDDVIVGVRGADPNGSNSGASYVVFGKVSGFAANLDLSSLDGSDGFKLSGAAAGDRSGRSVASAGDVNGDGFADLIIGADLASPNDINSGASYVVFGQASGFAANFNLSSLNGSNGFKLSGVAVGDFSGNSAASAGDVNGDGFADLIVGAFGADPNGINSGASYVVFGKASGFAANLNLSSLNGSNGFKLSGVSQSDNSGISVASAGDVNGDGFADLIVGAWGADPNGISSGASYVVFGKASGFAPNLNLSSLDGSNGFRLTGVAAGDLTGRSVASAGDVNGDGFADLIVGAFGADPNGSRSGTSHVVFGQASGFAANINLSSLDGSNGFSLSGAAADDYSGYSVASAGDVNGDGFADLIVAALRADPNGSFSGASYVVFGKAGGFAPNIALSSLDGTAGFKISGAATDDFSGRSVASAGDVNGDGFADLIVGAEGADPNGSYSGASYVVFGRAPTEPVVRTGTDASQTLAGGDFDDTLIGLGGDDELFGHGGSDTLAGGDGNDVLRGGAGDDDMSGGDGDDTYYVDSAGDAVVESPGQGADTVHTTASFSLGHNIENLIADSDAGLILIGNARDNTITGGEGDDRLVGNNGNDTLTGGAGRDVMIGGAQADQFVFQALSDSVVGGGRDLIKDFIAGTDKIDLTQIDANTGAASDQAFSFIGGGAFSNTAGELRATAFGANTLVAGDVDGNGQADFHILLAGPVTLQATDFVL
jgi:Ca2+-binding RTX toxin-like protein